MKKRTTIVTIILLVVIVGVVGVYAILQGRTRAQSSEATMTAVQKVLYRDLKTNYPPTVKEVVKYYIEIQKCFYSDSTSDEELEQLGLKARELFDEELLEANEVQGYLIKLKADVQDFKDKKRTMTSASVASSLNVDMFEADGYEFARISCNYSVMEGSVNNIVSIVYLLRKDENRLWKIYGWDNAENVNIDFNPM